MTDRSREAAIQARAYQLWEESGGTHGNHEEHWGRAQAEINDTAGRLTTPAQEGVMAVSLPKAEADDAEPQSKMDGIPW